MSERVIDLAKVHTFLPPAETIVIGKPSESGRWPGWNERQLSPHIRPRARVRRTSGLEFGDFVCGERPVSGNLLRRREADAAEARKIGVYVRTADLEIVRIE